MAELGQLLNSNSPIEEYEVSELAEAALRHLAAEIERVEWNNTQKHYEAPIGNNGGMYKTNRFVMQAYCWCDGERHPDGCPPNFVWDSISIRWYKYLGRGMSANKELTPAAVSKMLEDCLASVRAKEKPLY